MHWNATPESLRCKPQGSEYPAVVIPLATQHYMLLERNLLYTGVTRGRRLVVIIAQHKGSGNGSQDAAIGQASDQPGGAFARRRRMIG
jgi:hypothetical protein